MGEGASIALGSMMLSCDIIVECHGVYSAKKYLVRDFLLLLYKLKLH